MACATVGWWHRAGLVNQKSFCGKGVEQVNFLPFAPTTGKDRDSQITGESPHVASHQEIRCRPLEGRERCLFARVLPPHWFGRCRYRVNHIRGWRLGNRTVGHLEDSARPSLGR